MAQPDEERTGHPRNLIRELVHRLHLPRILGTKQVSEAAVDHGKVRRSQGYSIPPDYEESRMLQDQHIPNIAGPPECGGFRLAPERPIGIADEVDSELRQTTVSFAESAAALAEILFVGPHPELLNSRFAGHPIETHKAGLFRPV